MTVSEPCCFLGFMSECGGDICLRQVFQPQPRAQRTLLPHSEQGPIRFPFPSYTYPVWRNSSGALVLLLRCLPLAASYMPSSVLVSFQEESHEQKHAIEGTLYLHSQCMTGSRVLNLWIYRHIKFRDVPWHLDKGEKVRVLFTSSTWNLVFPLI